jgi:hypothetical protein
LSLSEASLTPSAPSFTPAAVTAEGVKEGAFGQKEAANGQKEGALRQKGADAAGSYGRHFARHHNRQDLETSHIPS